MTVKEVTDLLPHDAPDHPAFGAFCRQMHRRDYGAEPLRNAWAWFRDGWDEVEPEAEEDVLDVVLPDTKHDPKADPGWRLHIYRPPHENTWLSEEQVLPEKVDDPNARRVIAKTQIILTEASARWVRDYLNVVLDRIQREKTSP